MRSFSETRVANGRALSAFGVHASAHGAVPRLIRQGSSVTLYTIGYEKRDIDQLLSLLRDQGVKLLADVRQRPLSRKPEFRGNALREACKAAGIAYQGWPGLGSTAQQREELHDTGDFSKFATQFRALAEQTMTDDLARLAEVARGTPTALLCYEREHTECHRSIIADMLGQQIDATVVAI